MKVTLDAALVEKARRHGLNLSRLFEDHLRDVVHALEMKAWQDENRKAIAACNRRGEQNSIFSDLVRRARRSIATAGQPRDFMS